MGRISGLERAKADDCDTGRFSRDRPRFTDTLDVIKFLCKDLWMLVFRKQIDNLKTNHRVCILTSDIEILAYRITGRLCSDGQFVSSVCAHEY